MFLPSVLRERLTDRELGFLNLPVSSLQRNSNHDRLSMTTDELLSIPYDGTMPVTHTTAFLQGQNASHTAPHIPTLPYSTGLLHSLCNGKSVFSFF